MDQWLFFCYKFIFKFVEKSKKKYFLIYVINIIIMEYEVYKNQ